MENNIVKDDNHEISKNTLPPDNFSIIKEIKTCSIWGIDNIFIIYKSNNIFFLIYATIKNSIISYNLNTETINVEIKKAHYQSITNFRHYHKEISNNDFIMSIAGKINQIKIWDTFNWECILFLPLYQENNLIYSSTFFNENNKDYIITCGFYNSSINIYDFSGKIYKTINNSKDETFFIDYYFDDKSYIYYIITGNNGYIKSYNYNKNKLYHKYCDNDESWHISIKFNKSKNILKLLDACWDDDYIRIWDFHLGILLDKIMTNGEGLRCISIWDNNYIFVGCSDNKMRLIDINNKKVIKTFEGHSNWVCTIKKINHPKYGECLLSQEMGEYSKIFIWTNKLSN